ncbi:MAG: glycosyltransferase [Clostridia bacterium]|nr:glycosyltransferase [Clostridia bacterium]
MTKDKVISIIVDVTCCDVDTIIKKIKLFKKQTYKNIELILIVNKKYLKNVLYLETDTIKFFVSQYPQDSLKNIIDGYSKSKGEYCIFLNSDTEISFDLCRKMYMNMIINNADISIADWVYKNKNNMRQYNPSEEIRNNDYVLENKDLLDKYISGHGYNFTWELIYNKMLKRSLLEKSIPFLVEVSNIVQLSHMAFSMIVFANCNKLINCHNVPVFISNYQIGSNYEFQELKSPKIIYSIFDLFDKLLKNKCDENDIKNLEVWKNKILFSIQGHEFAKKKGKNFKLHCVDMANILIDFGNEYDCYENLISAIIDPSTKVVSFDIFDTLILRNTLEPSDVFDILCQQFIEKLSSSFYLSFKDFRLTAEQNARDKKNGYEVMYDDIYSYMINKYGFDNNLANKIKQKEFEIELDICSARNTGHDLYDIATMHDKTVVYTSDMYLQKDKIYQLLTKCGYSQNNKLYVSCEHGTSKHLGGLYEVVLKDNGIIGTEMVHVGDNYHSDYVMAKKNGIQAFHMPNVNEMFKNYLWGGIRSTDKSRNDPNVLQLFCGLRMMTGVVANKLYDFPYIHINSTYQCSPQYIGYYAVGMHLYAFVDWIINNSKGRRKIHFVARDGFLPIKAYDMFREYDSTLPQSNYLYLSRKFLYPLSMYKGSDFYASKHQMILNRHSFNKILAYFPRSTIKQDEVDKISEKKRKRIYANDDEFFKDVPLFSKCIDFKKLSIFRDKVKNKVLNDIEPNDIMVDVGYSGRDESILAPLLGFPLDSLYLHTRADVANFNFNKAKANNKCFYDFLPKVTYAIREVVLSSVDSSLKGFDENSDELIFSDSSENTEGVLSITATIQNNALQFIRDYLKVFYKYKSNAIYTKDIASLPWEVYLHRSSRFDKQFFECFEFEDDIGVGNYSLVDMWEALAFCLADNQNVKDVSFVRKIANKFLPYGTKRRAIVKKIYIKLMRKR